LWFLGAWKREWIRRGGVTDSKVTVRFLQTPTVFGDVRIPSDRPRFPRAATLADLKDEELAILAKQNGFFGYTTIEGDVATWHHEIDYQPSESAPDAGRLERVRLSGMYEHGLNDSYVENWSSLSNGDGRYLAVRVTKGDQRAPRLDRLLVVVGDHFAYARNRPTDLPTGGTLADLISKGHPGRETVLGYLDCELSYGSIRGGRVPWEIVNSTLPWREGVALEFAELVRVDAEGNLSARGGVGETWTFPVNTLRARDLHSIFREKED
jgi:hypothetical protein